ncbi:hypothetical protein [Allocoleopsis sp.]|uniref:hypothetical protein n=1 Tax=Allocoleopsis sp. TaxID=3088169 RepID=UPI002FD4B524
MLSQSKDTITWLKTLATLCGVAATALSAFPAWAQSTLPQASSSAPVIAPLKNEDPASNLNPQSLPVTDTVTPTTTSPTPFAMPVTSEPETSAAPLTFAPTPSLAPLTVPTETSAAPLMFAPTPSLTPTTPAPSPTAVLTTTEPTPVATGATSTPQTLNNPDTSSSGTRTITNPKFLRF